MLAKPETLFTAILGEREPELLGTTLDDVRRVLTFLETAGVIARSNGDGYVSETSVDGAQKLLAAFAIAPGQSAEGIADPLTGRSPGRRTPE